MYVAMNRFTIKPEAADDFEAAWKGRRTHLQGVTGIRSFRLLRSGAEFVSLSFWDSREDFESWTQGEAFARAHAQSDTRDMHARGPRFTGYKAVIEQEFRDGSA